MAMSVGKEGGDNEVMVEMNTTPLIDVMLVLLVMLIITIPIQTHAVKLDMPTPSPNKPLVEPEKVELVVDFDGTIYWNGTAVPDRATLQSYLRQAAETEPQPEIHLKPNRLARYDVVSRVLADAQRIGATKVGFANTSEFQ